jgi:hypothetical protein
LVIDGRGHHLAFRAVKPFAQPDVTRQDLRRLAAMAVAKHQTGAKHPNIQLVEKAAKAILDEPKSEK